MDKLPDGTQRNLLEHGLERIKQLPNVRDTADWEKYAAHCTLRGPELIDIVPNW